MYQLHTELQAHYFMSGKRHDNKQWGITLEGGQWYVSVCGVLAVAFT